jgi:hypothetical protein
MMNVDENAEKPPHPRKQLIWIHVRFKRESVKTSSLTKPSLNDANFIFALLAACKDPPRP